MPVGGAWAALGLPLASLAEVSSASPGTGATAFLLFPALDLSQEQDLPPVLLKFNSFLKIYLIEV